MPNNDTENIYSTEFENDPNPIPSSKIGYDNTESGLEAENVQAAIDEIDSLTKLGYKLIGEDTMISENVTSWSTFVSEKTDLDETAIKAEMEDDEAYLILGIIFGSLVTRMDVPTLVTKQTTSHFLAHFYSALVATDTAFGQWVISRGNPRYFSVKTNEMTPTLYKDDATAMTVKYHFLKFKKEITE